MLIRSDWHNHSEYSHDSDLPLKTLAEKADEYGFCRIGVTDHVNFNDAFFLNNLGNRANNLYPTEWRIRSSYTPEAATELTF